MMKTTSPPAAAVAIETHRKHHVYRPDIDGLRAVAIIPVVLFHLGFTGFAGGYVGVDVFYVISGYLITSLVFREVSSGTFTFGNFYERRIRRLFPAMFLVLITVTLAAFALLMPGDLKEFGRSLVAGSLFSSNLLFWQTAGYFAGPADMEPLLHMWSLSVEEQFYIFFPALLLIAARYLPGRVAAVVSVLGIASFVGSVAFIDSAETAVFYLPVTRAWELFLGAVLAMGAVPEIRSRFLREILAAAGVVMIAYSVYAFSSSTVFPGANALYPAVGTALLIHVGSSGASGVSRTLSLRPLVLIGLISYSLYLWHWPLIVFAKYFLARNLFVMEKVALIALSVGLAVLTWRYIERPFRGKSGILTRRALFGLSAAMIAVLVAVGMTAIVTDGLPGRVPSHIRAVADADHALTNPRCFKGALAESLQKAGCRLGVAGPPTFLFWGDSHALALASTINRVAEEAGAAGLFAQRSACPPLLGVNRYDVGDGACAKFNDNVVSLLKSQPNIRTVVLASRWALYSDGSRYGEEPGRPAIFSPDGIEGNLTAARVGFEKTLRFLNDRGIEPVIIEQVPEIGWEVASVLARAQRFNRPVPASPTTAEYNARQNSVRSMLADLSSDYRFRVIPVSDLFCRDEICSVEQDGTPLYRDSHHVTQLGASLLAPRLRQVWPVRSDIN